MKRIYRFLILLFILVSCSNNGDFRVNLGLVYYNAEQYGKAIKSFEAALDLALVEYEKELVYTMIGNAYNELGDYEKSISYHKTSIEINPEFHKSWVNLGIVYRLLGKYDEAEKCYMRALEIEPNYAELYSSLGALYIFKEEPVKAIQYLEESIELDNQLPVTYSNLALAQAYTGQFEEAEKSLKKAILLGYKNGDIVRDMINDLKAVSK